MVNDFNELRSEHSRHILRSTVRYTELWRVAVDWSRSYVDVALHLTRNIHHYFIVIAAKMADS